jgi:N-acetylmuramate 1-kinase
VPIETDAHARLRIFLERAMPLLAGPPGRERVHLECAPLAGDGSPRQLFRVHQAGTSAVAVLNPLPPARVRPDENEAFLAVREYLAQRGVRVPAVFAADVEQGLFLMEDLGDARLFEACRSGLQTDLYLQALELVILMQVPREPAFRPEVTSNPAYDETFILEHEAGYFLDEVVRGWCNLDWPREPVETDCRRLARQALSGPRVFMHRDFQSRNLMVPGWIGPADLSDSQRPDGGARRPRLAVIDFQGARIGPPEYDLAALLFDPYVDMAPATREELAARYLELAHAAGLPEVPNSAARREAQLRWRERFLANAANRLMQALGAFVKLGVRYGRPGFREHIPPGLARLQDVLAEKADTPALAALVRQVAAQAAGKAGEKQAG